MSLRAMSSWSQRRLATLSSPFSTSVKKDSVVAPTLLPWKENNNKYTVSTKFNVITFNMLAPVYKRLQSMDLETGNRKRESQNPELWKGRAQKALQFLRAELFDDFDIIGMQELWLNKEYLNVFEKDFQQYGYDLRLLQRTGSKLDAVALAIKKSTFKVVASENVFLCTLSDRVALVLWLQHLQTGKNFVVANTHLSFPHSTLEKMNQMRQMKFLTSAMQHFADAHAIATAPRLVMGDFNVEYTSPVCDHLRASGYASCFEVSRPENKRGLHSLVDAQDGANPNNHSPRSNTSAGRPLKFVSHRNHRNEEVGVDHIFVRPEHFPIMSSTGSISSTNNVHHQGGSQINHFCTEIPPENASVSDPSSLNKASSGTGSEELFASAINPQHVQNDDQLKIPTTTTTSATPSSEDDDADAHSGERLFVTNCRVLPQGMPCGVWENNFTVSDHRPVGATLIFARPVNSSHGDNRGDNHNIHVNNATTNRKFTTNSGDSVHSNHSSNHSPDMRLTRNYRNSSAIDQKDNANSARRIRSSDDNDDAFPQSTALELQ